MEKLAFDYVINTYFPVAKKDEKIIFALVENIDDMANCLYIIAHYCVRHYSERDINYVQFVTYFAKVTTCFISPFADLKNFKLNGINIYIGDNVSADENLTLGGGCIIGKDNNNTINDIKYVNIGKNCTFGNNVRICPGVNIGDGVKICDGAIIKENLNSNVEVEIVNQLQIKHTSQSIVGSQELIVYGMMPKYKNSLIIFGEGFYNPKVVLRLKSGVGVDYDISYWDKNKIIVKFKSGVKTTDYDSVVVVMSRGLRVTIINNIGVVRALKSINL